MADRAADANSQDGSGNAGFVVDADGVVLEARGEGKHGRLVEAVASGESALRHIHPQDQDLFDAMCRHAPWRAGREARVELRWARANGRWSTVFAKFRGDGAGHVRVTLEADEAQAARRSEEQMRRVVEGSAQGIVVRTQDRVLYMNETFANLIGYASVRECMMGELDVNNTIYPDDLPLVLHHLKARISGEEIVSHYEFRLLRRDRSPVWVETRAAIADWDGVPASLSWICDISQRKAMEAELVRSKEAADFANDTKTQFLANMSHELRTPLNAILGFSEMMQSALYGPLNAKYAEYAHDIHASGQHLLELINDVLDLSKLEAGKLELRESIFGVDELVAECSALIRDRAEAGRIALGITVPRGLPQLQADRRAVKQILLNLLSNAIKFTPEGGNVSVTAKSAPGRGLEIAVADSGIGMTDSDIEVAFTPFGQVDSDRAREHRGTGLGLPICKSLMTLHQGELSVASIPGAGTTFVAVFPAHRLMQTAAVA